MTTPQRTRPAGRRPNQHGPHETVVRHSTTRPTLVSGLASDAHTWNLVYLQLVLEELGHEVVNLGPCVPTDLLCSTASWCRPGLVVLSSVNGHGLQDGLDAIRALRADPELAPVPAVIGGKLGIDGDDSHRVEALVANGFAGVYDGNDPATPALFERYVRSLATAAVS